MMSRGSSRRIRLDRVCIHSLFLNIAFWLCRHTEAYSVLMTIGGSLGWKTRGSLDGAFEKTAYELEPSSTGSPKYAEVKTGFGYHIIMVEGRK